MEPLCFSCMKPLGNGSVCGSCGFDNATANPSYAIAAGTRIHERYLVGRCVERREDSTVYMGFDLRKQEPVLIRECFGSYDPDFDFASYREQVVNMVQCLDGLKNMPGILSPYHCIVNNRRIYLIEKNPKVENLSTLMRMNGRPYLHKTAAL